jgi:hypothetical protein
MRGRGFRCCDRIDAPPLLSAPCPGPTMHRSQCENALSASEKSSIRI